MHPSTSDLPGSSLLDLDLSTVQPDVEGRVVLLTGAAGSIGAELARQIAAFMPARLILLDHADSGLPNLHLQLRESNPRLELVPILCDIASQAHLAQVYACYEPEYVIHAAAYMPPPLTEINVVEAVRADVLGTLLVATNAVRYRARKMLLISTSKAGRTSTVMDATRRIAERIIFGLADLHHSQIDFRAVRLGNLVRSTADEAVREAARLALQAGSSGVAAGALTVLERPGEKVKQENLRVSPVTESPGPEVMQNLSRLLAFLKAGDGSGLLRTLCDLVPECMPSLQQFGSSANAGCSMSRAETRGSTVESGERWTENRRIGLVCRRRNPRVGGRRHTDAGALIRV